MSKELQKKWDEIDRRIQLENKENDLNRARSVTVGTAFGGTIEVMMRGNSGFMWCLLQPVEAIELIHQLAAGAGCHIQIKPRNDFASWRSWRTDGLENTSSNNWSPWNEDITPHMNVGAKLPPLHQQPGLMKLEPRSNENVMATEKPKNKRNTKRTAKVT